jgi:hypothetical protein
MPYTTFDSEDSKHFYESILPTLTPKLQKSNWLILNTEEPQERQTEAIDEAKVKFEKDKIKFLGSLAAKTYPKFAKKKVEACLSMCPETGWKWAWCVVECASHRHLGELSERFDTRTEADSWIREQLECMAST